MDTKTKLSRCGLEKGVSAEYIEWSRLSGKMKASLKERLS